MDLADSNLLYRAPDLYDQVQADPAHTTAKQCEELIDTYGPHDARTVLELGCGTGRDLEHLAPRFDCIGVDVQSNLVTYARRTRPDLDVRIGDMRGYRLGRTVDAVICVGNVLAYLHDNHDVQSAFATFAAHAHPGTLLILATPVAPIEYTESRSDRVDLDGVHARVTISYEWDLRTQINTMHRTWLFDDGRHEQDHIRRRVLFPRELGLYATLNGFEVIEMFSNPSTRDQPLSGSTAYIAARYSQS